MLTWTGCVTAFIFKNYEQNYARYYKNNPGYIKREFTCNSWRPQCVLLAIKSINHQNTKRRLETKHSNYEDKSVFPKESSGI